MNFKPVLILSVFVFTVASYHAAVAGDLGSTRNTRSGDYCLPRIDDQGKLQPGWGVNNSLIQVVPVELKDRFKQAQSLANDLAKNEVKAAQKLFVGANLNVDPNLLTSFIAKFNQLRTDVELIIEETPTAHRLTTNSLIEGYFQIGLVLEKLATFTNPNFYSLNALKNLVGLKVSASAVQKIYPPGEKIIEGLALENNYLSFSSENLFRFLARGGANSPVTAKTGENYLETVRCLLGRTVLAKLEQTRLVLNENQLPYPINGNEKFCYGAKAEEFIEFNKNDSNSMIESHLREKFSNQLTSSLDLIDADTTKLISERLLIPFTVTLYVYPGLLPIINHRIQNIAKHGGQPEPKLATEQELSMINSKISSAIEGLYSKMPELAALRKKIWESQVVRRELNSLLNTCHFDLRDNGINLNINQVVQLLYKYEDYIFAGYLKNDLVSGREKFIHMNESQIVEELRAAMVKSYLYASEQSLAQLFDYFGTAMNPEYSELNALISQRITPILEKQLNTLTNNSQMQSWFVARAKEIVAEQKSAASATTFVVDYTNQMIKKSKLMKIAADANTPAEILKYNPNYIVDAMQSSLSQLGPQFRQQLNIITSTKDFKQKRELWLTRLKPEILSEIKHQGVECKPLGLFSRSDLQRDCYLIFTLMGALAIERETEPTNLAHTLRFLSSQMKDDEVGAFIKSYREQLVGEIADEFRLLTAPIHSGDEGSPQLYTVLSSSIKIDEAIKLVKELLRRNITTLNTQLAAVVRAQSSEDLGFLIRDTKVINYLLGEGEFSQTLAQYYSMSEKDFFFPNLLRRHKNLQFEMASQKAYLPGIWGEYLQTQYRIALESILFMGGRWVFARSLTKSVGPSIATFFNKLVLGGRNYFEGQGFYVLGLMAADTAYQVSQKSQFSTELKNLNDLMRADAFDVSASSMRHQLIDWSSYRNQVLYVQSQESAATSAIWQNVAWATVPTSTIILASRIGKKVGTHLKNKRDTKMYTVGYQERLAIENRISRGIRYNHNILKTEIKSLGNLKTLEVYSLRNELSLKLNNAKTQLAKDKLQADYNRIIFRFGDDMLAYAEHPQLLGAYAKAMYGSESSTALIRAWIQEYVFLLKYGRVS